MTGPQWLEHISEVSGLDPLGVQAISINVYTYLLPGVSNVTSRLRYYTFLCWVLCNYSKTVKSKDIDDWRDYLRKSEFLFSLIAERHHLNDVKGEPTSTVGAATARPVVKHLSRNTIDLHIYTDLSKSEGTYFKNRGGGFAQYYQGPMKVLRLLDVVIWVTLYDIYHNESFDCSLEDYQDHFLDAVCRKDEEKALYYAYIIREVFDEDDSVFKMINDIEGRRNGELINDWIEAYNKARKDESRSLLFPGVVSLLFREIDDDHGEYLEFIDGYISKPIEKAEVPDRAFDKHTAEGRNMGRGMKHFIEEPSSLRNERFPNDWEDKGRRVFCAVEEEGLDRAPDLINAIREKFEKRKSR